MHMKYYLGKLTQWLYDDKQENMNSSSRQYANNNTNNTTNNNNYIERCNSRFFYNLLMAPWTVSNTFAQVARVQLCANHVQHIKRLSHATGSVPLGTKGQLSY